jgi:hypothetical protein
MIAPSLLNNDQLPDSHALIASREQTVQLWPSVVILQLPSITIGLSDPG